MIATMVLVLMVPVIYYIMTKDDDKDPNLKVANIVYIIVLLVITGYLLFGI